MNTLDADLTTEAVSRQGLLGKLEPELSGAPSGTTWQDSDATNVLSWPYSKRPRGGGFNQLLPDAKRRPSKYENTSQLQVGMTLC